MSTQGSSNTQEGDFESKYSQIIDYTEQIGAAEGGYDLNDAFQKINEICVVMDQTFKETKTSSDYLIDMNAMVSTSVAAKNLTKNVNSKMNNFNPLDFAIKVREKYQRDDGVLDLCRLYKYGDLIIKRTTFNLCMLNTFVPSVREIEQKKRTTRREKDVVTQKETSEKVSKIEKTDPTIDEVVNMIRKCLDRGFSQNNNQPISYFHFVLDPDSFSRSIENIFHTSFLIRDNRAQMGLGPDNLPTIQPVKNKDTGKENDGNGDGDKGRKSATRTQMTVSLTPKQHAELVELLPIKKPMIPKNMSTPVPLGTIKRAAVSNSPTKKDPKYRRE